MTPTRREALMLAAAMGTAAALSALARTSLPDSSSRADVDLQRLFPLQFGNWHLDDASSAFVPQTALGGQRSPFYEQLLERTFVDDRGRRVMLSVAFDSVQTASRQLHRPEVCYRAGGYQVSATQAAAVTLAGQVVTVTRLKAEMPGRPEPVTYWTLFGGEVLSDPVSFRWKRLNHAIGRRLLDGMLVRVSSIEGDPATAYVLHAQFADAMVQAIPPSDRIKVIGPSTPL